MAERITKLGKALMKSLTEAGHLLWNYLRMQQIEGAKIQAAAAHRQLHS